MSYNIDNIETLSGSLFIKSEVLLSFKDVGMPEYCFLKDYLNTVETQETVEITSLRWQGIWSGNTVDILEKFILLTTGQMSVLVVWEDGDSVEKWEIDNGTIKVIDVS